MTDPNAPASQAPDAAPQSAPSTPAAQPTVAPAPVPPRVLNVYATAPQRPASAVPASPPAVVQPAPSASPQEPASAPAADPRVDALMAVLGETVEQDLAALPANIAAAARAIGKGDPVATRNAINALRANGVTGTAAPAPLPVPTSTGAVGPNPPPAPEPPTGDAAVLAEYRSLKSRGAHVAAATFYAANAPAIQRAEKSATN